MDDPGRPKSSLFTHTHTSPKPNVRSRAVAGWMRLDFCDCVLKYYCLPIHKSVFIHVYATCALCDVRCAMRRFRRADAPSLAKRENERRDGVGRTSVFFLRLRPRSGSARRFRSIPSEHIGFRFRIVERAHPGVERQRGAKDGRTVGRRQRVSLGVATTTTDDA